LSSSFRQHGFHIPSASSDSSLSEPSSSTNADLESSYSRYTGTIGNPFHRTSHPQPAFYTELSGTSSPSSGYPPAAYSPTSCSPLSCSPLSSYSQHQKIFAA
jgi:hypothetical protein